MRLFHLRADLESQAVHSMLFDEMCRFPGVYNDPNTWSDTNAIGIATEMKRLAGKL